MTKKEIFINEIKELLTRHNYLLSEDAQIYFDALQLPEEKESSEMTEKGRLILKGMQSVCNEKNLFKAADIALLSGLAAKVITGSARKLVADGYLEKVGDSKPIVYALTEKGKAFNCDAE